MSLDQAGPTLIFNSSCSESLGESPHRTAILCGTPQEFPWENDIFTSKQ